MAEITIITPVYNAQNYIVETMESVAAQTFGDWELLLVDDCSTDQSISVIEQYIEKKRQQNPNDHRIQLIRQPFNQGAAAARNAGIKMASGRYLAFLDADDIWDKDKLSREFDFMRNKHVGFVFTSYRFGDENAKPTGKVTRVPETLSYRKALSRTVIFTSTVLIDTNLIGKELCYMPNIPSEDTATWWQILRSGVTAYGLDELLVTYRRPAGSLSSNKGKAIARIWNLYRRFAGLSIPVSLWNLLQWAFRASARRLIKRSEK